MNLKLPSFNRSLALPPQLQWKLNHEPELLDWTIRARNYNTAIANGMCIFMTPIILGLTYISYTVDISMEPLKKLSICILFMTLMLFGLIGTTHQTMKFAYRLTQSGVEICEWKDFPQWAITFLKWFTPFIFILFLFLATIDPAFLLGALVGPAGTALTYLSMLKSKSYQGMHTRYNHINFEWHELTKICIATNREIIELHYNTVLEGDTHESAWTENIFCKRNQKHHIADIIRPFLKPNTPITSGKVEVL